MSLGVKLVCGAIAGVIGTSIIFPMDLVKTRLQNQKVPSSGVLPYNGMRDCFVKIIQKEGVAGLYKGIGPNLIGIIPEKAIKLAVNDFTREHFGRQLGIEADKLPLLYGMAAGATAGLCQVVATNPMEIVKIQLQLAGSRSTAGSDGKNPQKAPPPPSAWQVVKTLGPKGLYKGTFATLSRDVPFSLMFFSLVSILKDLGTPKDKKTPLWIVFGSGIVSGAFAAALVTPMDVVKTRLQVIPQPGDMIYKGQLHCYRSIIATEGVQALFKGVVPRMLIVSPLFAITVAVYEAQQRLFASPSSATKK